MTKTMTSNESQHNQFSMPQLDKAGDPSSLFPIGHKLRNFVSGGRGYDEESAVVIDTDDFEIMMDIERDFVKYRAEAEIAEAACQAGWINNYEYKFNHEFFQLGEHDVVHSTITLKWLNSESDEPCIEKYHTKCCFDISRAFNGDVSKLEDLIVRLYDDFDYDTPSLCHLLKLRKHMINREALKHQEKLLPDIIAFNDALTQALHEMLDKAHYAWEKLSLLNDTAQRPVSELSIKLSFGDYPKLHPVQDDKRDTLWAALHDPDLNPLYDFGISLTRVIFPGDLSMSFDSLIGMDCPPPNWNEGLDPELTKDLHLTSAFHNVFEHMNFAITDIIYVRDFVDEMEVEFS